MSDQWGARSKCNIGPKTIDKDIGAGLSHMGGAQVHRWGA